MWCFFSISQSFDRSHKAVRGFRIFLSFVLDSCFLKQPEVPQYKTDGKMFLLIFFSGFQSFLAVAWITSPFVWRNSLFICAEHELAVNSQFSFYSYRGFLAIWCLLWSGTEWIWPMARLINKQNKKCHQTSTQMCQSQMVTIILPIGLQRWMLFIMYIFRAARLISKSVQSLFKHIQVWIWVWKWACIFMKL